MKQKRIKDTVEKEKRESKKMKICFQKMTKYKFGRKIKKSWKFQRTGAAK